MDKQLRKLYRSLPYILFKKKYLIPHPPKRSHFPYTSFKTNPFGMIQKYFPEALDEKTHEMFKAGNNVQLREIFNRQSQKSERQHVAAVKEYMKEYVTPFKTIAKGIQPEIIYLRENRSKIKEIMLKEGQIHYFSTLYREFKKLPEEEKRKYREKAEEAIQQQAKVYSEQAAKYMVPQRTYLLPNVIYLRDTVNGPITRNMMGLFKKLPEEQKKIYRERSAEMRKTDLKNLEEFLSKRNLSLNQYKVIKKVSQEFEKAKSKLKKQRKDEKQKKLEIMDFEEQQHTLSQQDIEKPAE